MKLYSTILPVLLAATAVNARSWFNTNDAQKPLDDDLVVPGNNPLEFCDKADNYILTIESADIDPNPPAAGKTLKITASGTLKEEIKDGAKMHVVVTYGGYIKLINQDLDLCEYSKQVELECPLKKGDLKLEKSVDLPAEIPPGKYGVEANVTTVDNEIITCLKATIAFSR